ncbi:fumarate reductase [Porphyromonadaceae bacterium COT-184 OH4590]|nr:fumarate reductase [Porphyromonadaceae bacterium COT-184 OH4590]
MWLINSSIGRKFVMSITGLALVLFLLFHGTMNFVAILSPESYNAICHLLGANWYALVATVGLAVLVILHFTFASVLTWQNYKARGKERYSVSESYDEVSFASRNMFVLGVIIIGFMVLHLYNFWFKMQFVEIVHKMGGDFGDISLATDGAYYIRLLFANPVYCVLYLIWLGAIWYHLNHGVWSSLQTLGLSNSVWFKRIKCIGKVVATIVVLLFVSVVVYFGAEAIMNGTTAYVW